MLAAISLSCIIVSKWLFSGDLRLGFCAPENYTLLRNFNAAKY
jgi:hypothetical protein